MASMDAYPEWAINISVIKTILGITTLPIADDDLVSEALILPILLQLDDECPTWVDEEDEGKQSVYQIVIANLVGASILISQPKVTSSRMGDSSFTLGDGVSPIVFENRARQLLGQVCPISKPATGGASAFFNLAKGNRVKAGRGPSKWGKGLW